MIWKWSALVGNYSSRNLTFGKDKLPALAGLAQKIHEDTKYTYVTGLWLETLLWGLPWSEKALWFQYQKPKQPKALDGQLPGHGLPLMA